MQSYNSDDVNRNLQNLLRNSNTFRYYNYYAKLSFQKVRLTMSMHNLRRSSEWFHLTPASPPAEFI